MLMHFISLYFQILRKYKISTNRYQLCDLSSPSRCCVAGMVTLASSRSSSMMSLIWREMSACTVQYSTVQYSTVQYSDAVQYLDEGGYLRDAGQVPLLLVQQEGGGGHDLQERAQHRVPLHRLVDVLVPGGERQPALVHLHHFSVSSVKIFAPSAVTWSTCLLEFLSSSPTFHTNSPPTL